MHQMTRTKKITALFTVFFMLMSGLCMPCFCSGADTLPVSDAAPVAGDQGYGDGTKEGGDRVIYLSTPEDFYELSRGAKSQSYSTGKTFILTADISLSEYEDINVPYLDGVFEGNGHVISGYRADGDFSDCGLFRYVAKEGAVMDLTVMAEVISGDDQRHIGIIAGTNEGRLARCKSMGTVNAQSQVGGIAGYNAPGGLITSCVNEAVIDGKYQTGGIAGFNEGRITNCTNNGSVNINSRIKRSMINSYSDAVNISLPNAVTGFAADERANETGGIAGCSKGIISYCINTAPVGYKELGGSSGGIAGRSSGNIQGCENRGVIYAHSMAGGIVGMLDPYKAKELDRDVYSEVSGEFDDLKESFDGLKSTGRRIGDDLFEGYDDIDERVRNLRKSLQGYLDGYDSDIRTLRWQLHYDVEDLEDVIDDMDYNLRLRRIKDSMKTLREDLEEISDLTESLTGILDSFSYSTRRDIEAVIARFREMSVALGVMLDKLEGIGERLKEEKDRIESGIYDMTVSQDRTEDGAGSAPDRSDEDASRREDAAEREIDEFYEDELFTEGLQENAEEPEAGEREEVQLTDGASEAPGETENVPGAEEREEDSEDDIGTADKAPASVESDGHEGDADRSGGERVQELTRRAGAVRPVAFDSVSAADVSEAYGEAMSCVNRVRGLFQDALSQGGKIADCLEKWPSIARDFQNDMRDISDKAKEMHSAVDVFLNSAQGRTDVMRADLRDQGDELLDRTGSVKDSLEKDWDELNDIMDQFSDRFDALRTTLKSSREELKGVIDEKSVYVDVSETDSSYTGDGKIICCTNSGEIYAGSCAGGIAGCIDIEDVKDRSVDIFEKYRYRDDYEEEEEEEEEKDSIVHHVRAVVAGCVNKSDISTDSGYAGGVAGKARYGLIVHCESFCDVSSGDGSWAGGIAGLSKLTVSDSYSFGGVQGKSYLGGIAGRGENIINTVSCTYFDPMDENVRAFGAVAGKAMGMVRDNTYVDNGIGAVDGITKTGEASGESYDKVVKEHRLPDGFTNFTVRFMDGDETVWSGDYSYGQSLEKKDYPQLVGDEGEYAYWEEKKVSPIVRNVTVHSVRRVFVPSIASSGTSPQKPLLILEGEFYPDSRLFASQASDSEAQEIGEIKSELLPGSRYVISKIYKYSISQSEEVSGEMRIRALGSLIDPNRMFVLDSDKNVVKEPMDISVVGEYGDCTCALPESGYIVTVVYVTDSTLAVVLAAFLLLAAIVIIAALFYKKRIASRRTTAQEDADGGGDEGEPGDISER